MSAITTDDLLEALAVAMGGSAVDDAHTMEEYQEATGWAKGKLRKALKLLQSQGRLECHHVRRPSLTGASIPVPAYRIKPK